MVVKIRRDELSHMGLDIHKVVLLWYLANGVINIERCDNLRWHNLMVSLLMYGKIERFTRKVVEHNNVRLIKARVPVMGSAESGGTFVLIR